VLCACDFDRGIKVGGVTIAGLGLDATRFDWANVIAEANVCDESITLADAVTTQKRYTVNGTLDPKQSLGDLRRHFQLAFAGDSMPSDSKWRYYAGAYRAPTLSLVDAHFVGPLQHHVTQGESERYDTAQGSYASRANFGTVVDYAPFSIGSTSGSFSSSSFDTGAFDTGAFDRSSELSITRTWPRVLNLDFQLVDDGTDTGGVYDGGARAQRIAKLMLEREAAGKQIKLTTSLYGLRCVPGETVQITRSSFGLSTQTMRVMEVTLRLEPGEGGVTPLVDLTLQAGPSELYAWDAEETPIAPAPVIPQLVVQPPAYGWNWTPIMDGVSRGAVGHFVKTGGSGAAWDAQVYSKEWYTRCCTTFKPQDTSLAVMVGLNSDPTADASYTSLDYAIYLTGGALQIYESGSSVFTGGSYSTNDLFAIVYDGIAVRYYQNQTLLRQTLVASPNTKLYLDSSFYAANSGVDELQFGPIMNAGTYGIDPSAATEVYSVHTATPGAVSVSGGYDYFKFFVEQNSSRTYGSAQAIPTAANTPYAMTDSIAVIAGYTIKVGIAAHKPTGGGFTDVLTISAIPAPSDNNQQIDFTAAGANLYAYTADGGLTYALTGVDLTLLADKIKR
jgi:hypothetical protein